MFYPNPWTLKDLTATNQPILKFDLCQLNFFDIEIHPVRRPDIYNFPQYITEE